MNKTTQIIVLAYPDTFVTMSDEWICRLLPLVGLGTRHYIKAGHAALLLVSPTGQLEYFDFGRYITPRGLGRVRSKQTDAELQIPIRVSYNDQGSIGNLNNILNWLDQHPGRTHGEGRLLASVCSGIDYQSAHSFILQMQQKGSIPYGAFHKQGSNCSRFVADTLLASASCSRIKRRLKWNKLFTPSTVGNVEIASTDGQIHLVSGGKISRYGGSALRENLKNYFDKKKPKEQLQQERRRLSLPENAQFLDGIGSQAWFYLDPKPLGTGIFRICRYNPFGELDYEGVYSSDQFDVSRPYRFIYDSNCSYCHIWQGGKKIKLESQGSYNQVNSWQNQHAVGM